MPSADSAKKLGKRIIAHPEETVPVVSTRDWFEERSFDPKVAVVDYLTSLFPIFGWITRYNLGWLSGDIIAGLTVGMVLVPQGMSYAQIATLSPEYGLYSSFVGVLIYCLFATSKDVSIGPVAVMSLTVSQIIASVESSHPGQWDGPLIATTVAFICGFIVLGIGLLRLGWIVDFIPAPAISGFMTGSAISIVAGQVPGLMGISGFDTRASTYKVIINSLKHLPSTTMDAAFGLPALVFLYGFRVACDKLSKRYPRHCHTSLLFASVLRNAFTVIVLTIAAWLYCRHNKNAAGSYPIKILKNVPSGFKHIGQPVIDRDLISALAGELPVATIILLLEHIAISKSFGRVNGYKINPNQELIAIGVTNLVGSCFNAYPATGSFSRSALKSKCGVRTPAAGIVTAVVVLVALYADPLARSHSRFFWIPSAALSAVIIHAVADLVASPAQVYSYWRVAPLEFIIWLAAVLITIFTTIENGIYASICASLALMLIRVAHPRGKFLGKVILRRSALPSSRTSHSSSKPASIKSGPESECEREIYVPLAETGEGIEVIPPAPGVIIYRFEESYLYPNSSVMNERIVDYVRARTRRGKDFSNVSLADRAWNDPGPRGGSVDEERERNDALPLLRAVVLDFSSVSHIDTTAVQSLIDTRNEIERWTDAPVEFHFASILSPWIRRALVAGGFGFETHGAGQSHEVAPVVPYRDGLREGDPATSPQLQHDVPQLQYDAEAKGGDIVERSRGRSISDADLKRFESDLEKDAGVVGESEVEMASLVTDETPFFHLDLQDAVRAAEGRVLARRLR
ncbi:sulfate transporter family-domain-containing protein [Schizophyllum amplum]|uniref:Sulfate transporter family-domain-containing protein n=1 Tax=Schizophyllum amplum TaxID=97359 RepID=A0A550BVE4_9AGAR|nr:sulfate transporter family-domain-containing protein [Auriculariopsis ampla]